MVKNNDIPESNTEPSRRDISRQYDKERKKLRRAIARVEKRLQQAGLTQQEIAHGNENLKYMKKQLVESKYSRKNGYGVKLEKFKSDVSGFVYVERGLGINDEPLDDETRQNKNRMFIHEMNASTRKNSYSALRGEETRLFYQTTMKAWRKEGENLARNNAILEKTGFNQLESVYNMLIHPKEFAGDDEAKQLQIKQLLYNLGYSTSYEDYIKHLEKIKKRFPKITTDAVMSTTEELPADKPEKTGSPDFLSFWGSYLDSIAHGEF